MVIGTVASVVSALANVTVNAWELSVLLRVTVPVAVPSVVGPPFSEMLVGSIVMLTVAIGDEILYGKYAGNEIKWDGEDYKILRESEVLALITR